MSDIQISIDENAGFCWGVVRTLEIAEESVKENPDDNVKVLGQIIHNPHETKRLKDEGLETIDSLDGVNSSGKVIIRAHGEPPSTYEKAKKKNVEIIDATCPLVKRLQRRIKERHDEGWQIIILGKSRHAEVIGLQGVCDGEAIIVRSAEDALEKVDFGKKTILFSQTTMDKRTFRKIADALRNKFKEIYKDKTDDYFLAKDTICHFVSGREDNLKDFCEENDVIVFVAGRNSSNGRSLFNVCKSVKDKVFFIEDISEIDYDWFKGAGRIGISGATSTPQWYMKRVKEELKGRLSQ